MFKIKGKQILYLSIFIPFLTSMNCWIGWNGRAVYINLLSGVVMLACVISKKIPLVLSKKRIGGIIILLMTFFYFKDGGALGLLSFFLPVSIILTLRDTEQISCLECITKWLAYLLIPGFILFALSQFIYLPSLGVYNIGNSLEANSSAGYGIYSNHFFYVKALYFSDYRFRFNGPFTEPGQLATMLSLLLFANQFDFKRKEVKLLLFFNIMTFSLAGYALTLIGFVLYRYYAGFSMKWVLFCAGCVLSVYLIAMFYNDGDNVINNMIVSRLEYDEEKGFSGNNRSFGLIPYYYATMWSDRHLILYGYGKETMEWLARLGSRGTGYVYWMVSYGVIGTVVAFLFYIYNAVVAKEKKFAFLFFLFLVAVFWQRSKPLWISWFICFVYGLTYAAFKIKNGMKK